MLLTLFVSTVNSLWSTVGLASLVFLSPTDYTDCSDFIILCFSIRSLTSSKIALQICTEFTRFARSDARAECPYKPSVPTNS